MRASVPGLILRNKSHHRVIARSFAMKQARGPRRNGDSAGARCFVFAPVAEWRGPFSIVVQTPAEPCGDGPPKR